METLNIYILLHEMMMEIEYYVNIRTGKNYEEYCCKKLMESEKRFLIKVPQIDSKEYQKIKEKFYIDNVNNNIKKNFKSYLEKYPNYHGAFHNFIIDYKLEEKWFEFEEKKLLEIAMEFCEKNKIRYLVDKENINIKDIIKTDIYNKEALEYYRKKYNF